MGLPLLGSIWGLLQAPASAKPRRWKIWMMMPRLRVEPMMVISTGSRVGTGVLVGCRVWVSVLGTNSCIGIRIFDRKNCAIRGAIASRDETLNLQISRQH